MDDRGGASCCDGGSRLLGSVNPPFFFPFELSLSSFFSQTPHLNRFSHRLNQNIFIFG